MSWFTIARIAAPMCAPSRTSSKVGRSGLAEAAPLAFPARSTYAFAPLHGG
ncbi:Hypothetical protein A7982_07570 [Minicystis rosea]|nr:Hypothetical protein A7982_07570 [Minicystis rosea]